MTGAKIVPGPAGKEENPKTRPMRHNPGLAKSLCDIADDLVKVRKTPLRQRMALLQTTELNMQCPECGTDREGCFSIACWVYVDNGEAAETCGDANYPKPGEPPQSAYCSNCDTIFGPRPGHVFRVVNGRPKEVEL